MTFFKSILVFFLALGGLALLSGCDSSAELIPDAPSADEIEPFDPEKLQLFYTITVAQAISLLKNNPDTLVVDVRTPEDFAEGHITGALNFDAKFEGFRQEIETLDWGAKVIVYGSFANNRDIRIADGAIAKMKTIGFRDVYRMTGGIEGWIEAGQPFVEDLP